MANCQFPYSKVIREDGEVIPASDHNKQEHQIECLTEAVGDYDFSQGTIEERLRNAVTAIGSLDDRIDALEGATPVVSLDDLSDVTITSPLIGEVLTFTSTGWRNRPNSGSGGSLGFEVDLTGIQEGDSLVFDANTSTSGIFRPRDRRVKVVSGAPGSAEESQVEEVNEIRFITDTGVGEAHYVTQIAAGVAYIGGGAPPSALSTLTGLSGLVTGRLSDDPLSLTTYPPATPAGSSYTKITQNATWTFDTIGGEFGNASLGNLILRVNGVDVANIDLEANFREDDRATGQVMANYDVQGSGSVITNGVVTFTGGTLSILSVQPSSGIPLDSYQIGAARITLTSAALRKGYNEVILRHVASATNSATLDWFYDTDPAGAGTNPSISATDLTEGTPVLKPLSGINYYDTGSTFDLDITGLRLFNNVYHSSSAPITVSTTWNGSPTIAITDPSVSGVSNPADIGETMTVSNLSTTVLSNIQDSDARATSTPRDPYGSYSAVQTASHNFVIMSVPANSTSIYDSFVDERYRLANTTNFNFPITGIGSGSSWVPFPAQWDSNDDISGTTELQVYDHTASPRNRLIYPVFDYSNSAAFQPQPNPDYSGLAGAKQYYRVFRATDGLAKSNGIITFPGVTESDLSAGLGLRIKVPGKTVWLDLASAFNAGTFPTGAVFPTGVDGEGCRINSGVNNLNLNGRIEFSLGAYGTDSSSDFQLILEISYTGSSVTEIIGSGAGVSINW